PQTATRRRRPTPRSTRRHRRPTRRHPPMAQRQRLPHRRRIKRRRPPSQPQVTINDQLLRPKPKVTKRAKETKILAIDIERHPGAAYWYDPRTTYIPPANWIYPPYTVCWAAQWVGTDDVEFRSDWDDGHEQMLRRAWELVNEADQLLT